MMIKNLLFLIAAIVIFFLSLLFFQIFGNYAFLIMIVITFFALISRVKPKFGSKDETNK